MYSKFLSIIFLLLPALIFSQNTAYISAKKGQSIQIINTTTNTLSSTIGSISSDTNWRNNERTIGISADNKYLFQDCYNCGGTKRIEISNPSSILNIPFADKGGMISSKNGKKIYTASAYEIKVYDVDTNTVSGLASRNTGTCNSLNPNEAYQSVRLALNSSETKLYVANLDPRKKGISVYDTSTGAETKIHSGITGATKLDISSDNNYVYVLNTYWGYGSCSNDPSLMTDINGVTNSNHTNDIAIINTGLNSVIDYITVGAGTDIVANKDGSRIYISTISEIKIINRNLDTNAHALSGSSISLSGVTQIQIDPTGSFLYAIVSNTSLKRIDLDSGTITSIPTTSGVEMGNIVFEQPLNSTPTNITLSSLSINENESTGTTVGGFTTTDTDSGDSHTYTLVSGTGDTDNASFSVSGANLLSAAAFDYETKSSYSILVQTSDGTAIYTKTFTISITDVDEDSDGDSVTNSLDNCPTTANADQADADGDGVGDVCDNAPTVVNANQLDTDGDGQGDVIDTDDDGDGVPDSEDTFPLDPSESTDTDGDGVGDTADTDKDGDGVLDTSDNCPLTANASQLDTDGDGTGDACDPDDDNDDISDIIELQCGTDPLDASDTPIDTDSDGTVDCLDTDDDNDGQLDTDEIACGSNPLLASSMSLDTDSDGTPDCVDTDDDNDTYLDTNDAFPLDATEWLDTDNDGIGNNADLDDDNDGQSDTDETACGSNPLDATSLSLDTDSDNIPDCVDNDDDDDGVEDTADEFPLDPLEWTDTDEDGTGNNADTDDDNDGFSDIDELSCDSDPLNPLSKPADQDGDGIADCIDTDRDGDGCENEQDAFPDNADECVDTDGDGVGDNFEVDDDGDGYLDTDDAFPLDPTESKDSDGDGIGDNADTDDNNDGFTDQQLFISGMLSPTSGGLESTWKIINIDKYPNARVTVYNKIGQEVFNKSGYKNNWGGTYKKTSNILPSGSYFYKIDLNDGSKGLSGWLYITY